MKVLLSGAYHPRGTLPRYERALKQVGSVNYCGLPYGFERPGYSPDLDLHDVIKSDPHWDCLLYIHEWKSVFPRGIQELPFPTIAYFPDAAIQLPRGLAMAPFFDFVFVGQRRVVPIFKKVNSRTYHLPFALDPERTSRVFTQNKLYDVASVGGLHKKRISLMADIAKIFKVNDYLKMRIPTEEMGRIYSHSRIVFNCRPPQFPLDDDDNLRIFEGMGCGSLVVTETFKHGSASIFEPGRHFVTYSKVDELIPLLDHYLRNAGDRERIAEAGYYEVVKNHTFAHRVNFIEGIVTGENCRLQAPVRSMNQSAIFGAYQKVYSELMMIESMANLFAQGKATRVKRLQSTGLILTAVARRLRRMGWRSIISGDAR